MRLAIVADIHSNIIALEKVLKAIQQEKVDRIVCLGDVVNIGARPREVIACLRQLDCLTIMGNHDEWMLKPDYHSRKDTVDEVVDMYQWTSEQLTDDDLAYLNSFKSTAYLELSPQQNILFFHGSPRSNKDLILAETPDHLLDNMFNGCHASLLVGGHSHIQLMRYYRGMRLVNPGSVGLSFTYHPQFGYSPWAEFTIITWQRGRIHLDMHRLPLDITRLTRDARQSGMPHASWWGDAWQRQ
ncbi:MAG: metallophosphoesterase [Anaerolineae bacterium]|nr:metallophosphoesterase [Anaerolineae bacterium]